MKDNHQRSTRILVCTGIQSKRRSTQILLSTIPDRVCGFKLGKSGRFIQKEALDPEVTRETQSVVKSREKEEPSRSVNFKGLLRLFLLHGVENHLRPIMSAGIAIVVRHTHTKQSILRVARKRRTPTRVEEHALMGMRRKIQQYGQRGCMLGWVQVENVRVRDLTRYRGSRV